MIQRRRPDSNRRIKVLQTSALPLGYVAEKATYNNSCQGRIELSLFYHIFLLGQIPLDRRAAVVGLLEFQAHVRLGQGRDIVHPIADHRYFFTQGLQFLDLFRFVLEQHFHQHGSMPTYRAMASAIRPLSSVISARLRLRLLSCCVQKS